VKLCIRCDYITSGKTLSSHFRMLEVKQEVENCDVDMTSTIPANSVGIETVLAAGGADAYTLHRNRLDITTSACARWQIYRLWDTTTPILVDWSSTT
jgi:hypothetical protein